MPSYACNTKFAAVYEQLCIKQNVVYRTYVNFFNSKLASINSNNIKLYNLLNILYIAQNEYEIEFEELTFELTNILNEYSNDINNLIPNN